MALAPALFPVLSAAGAGVVVVAPNPLKTVVLADPGPAAVEDAEELDVVDVALIR
jgi:hypothetical protein